MYKRQPEDWAGLREYVTKNALPLKDEILSIIDKNENDYDVKEGVRWWKRRTGTDAEPASGRDGWL